ncbi:MAG: polysaccharide deacetylase family protein, partial [Myxococcaceae bacterium]|nr:polysaccharide deacetylase family protein [Myxococcaceae bacterium]
MCALGLFVALTTTARAETVVTLGFDDGHVSHRQVKDILAPYGMRATLYVITGHVGRTGNNLTLQDLRDFA